MDVLIVPRGLPLGITGMVVVILEYAGEREPKGRIGVFRVLS